MCAQTRQVKVISLSMQDFTAVLRGEARVRNFPSDGQVLAACPDIEARRVGVCVFSAQFRSVPAGVRLPVLTAVIESLVEVTS